MSIFPLNTGQATLMPASAIATTPPLAMEYAWDYTNNDFLLVDGKNVIVVGTEAVKVWIWKCLETQKNTFKAYDGNFGNDLETLYGQGYSVAALKSEIERYLKEALLVSVYITGISAISITVDGSKTDVGFTAATIYGAVVIGSGL